MCKRTELQTQAAGSVRRWQLISHFSDTFISRPPRPILLNAASRLQFLNRGPPWPSVLLRPAEDDIAVQLLSCVRLFATPWTAAHQAFLSFTISWSLLKLMSTDSLMSSNHLVLCHLLLFLQSCHQFSQFSSVTQSCLALCHPMNCSTPGLPVHHQHLEFT